jgi:antitoxin PrlF
VRVTEKGQVTIPQAVRHALGIRPGDEVEIECEDEHAVIRRVSRPERVAERIAAYRGAADAGLNTEEILELTRR